MCRKVVFFVIASVVLLSTIANAEAKRGFYLGLGPAYNTIQGDFDGNAGLQGDTEVIILPDIDSAVGIDFLGGYRVDELWAIEFDFITSGHSGTWQGLNGDVRFFSFSLNGKYTFASSNNLRPYLLFGISNNLLIIDKGAADIFTGEVADATLSGSGFNAGVGIDDYLSPDVSLNLGFMYRYVNYTHADGVHQSGAVDHGINGSGISLVITTAYHF